MPRDPVIAFRLDPVLVQELDNQAAARGWSRTDVANVALRAWCASHPIGAEAEEDAMNIHVISGGRTLPTHKHDGRTYLEVPKEGTFEIMLENASCVRHLAVVTVDGVNVIDGSTGSMYGNGYVLDGYTRASIPGWKRGSQKGAAFTFTSPSGGYASQTGRPQNTGVIGVAWFSEKRHPVASILRSTPPRYEEGLTKSFSPRGDDGPDMRGGDYTRDFSCSVEPASFTPDVATGYGQEVDFQTTSTTFEREARPIATEVLYYATRERLIEMGVISEVSAKAPQAFPADEGPMVPPPVGWRG